MTKKNNHHKDNTRSGQQPQQLSDSNYDRQEQQPLPGGFRGKERDEAEFIWEKTAALPPLPNRQPDRNETEIALADVHRRLGFTRGEQSLISRPLMAWIAAAALILLAFGIGYLYTPQTIIVPYGERVTTELPDGSELVLNSGTTLQYGRLFGYRNREVILDGEAYFTVASGNKPFLIHANNSVVEVTGTSFNIRSRSDEPGPETRVHVTGGRVTLYPADRPDRKVVLEAGNWSRWNETMEEPMAPEYAAVDQIAVWRENHFNFNNESLEQILREIERRFNIRIRLEAENVASEVLTAHYISPERPETIIEDICHVKGLRYTRTVDGFRIYR